MRSRSTRCCPPFPAIGEALGVADANDRQYVLSAYMFGSAIGALFYGSLADRLRSQAGAAVGAAALMRFSPRSAAFRRALPRCSAFALRRASTAAAMGVVALAVIRDRYSGDRMARLVSLVFIVFMAMPIIAPDARPDDPLCRQLAIHLHPVRRPVGLVAPVGLAAPARDARPCQRHPDPHRTRSPRPGARS